MMQAQELRKLCHAQIGQHVQLTDALGKLEDEVFVVCAVEQPGRRPGRPGQPHGLYDDQRKLFLMSTRSGNTRPMPHLSSRAKLLNERSNATPQEPIDTAPPSQVFPAHAARLRTKDSRGRVQTQTVDLGDPAGAFEVLKEMALHGRKLVTIDWLTSVVGKAV